MSKFNDFIKELSSLYLKYGVTIDGCGCCDSPYLSKLSETKTNEKLQDYLEYKFQEYSHHIKEE